MGWWSTVRWQPARRGWSSGLTACLAALALAVPARGHAVEAFDYLLQKVCVDGSDQALAVDPYNPPEGSRLRALRVGEALPYFKHDQRGGTEGQQRHDSYPVVLRSGERVSLNPFDFGENHTGNGYDVYCVRDGWASVSDTRDGGGFSTTFFGKQGSVVVPWSGWVLFPIQFLSGGLKPGSAKMPIAGRYWEHNGEPWPGQTPTNLFPNSETSWRMLKDCQFGGANGNPAKKLNAIQSVHGYVSKPDPVYRSNMQEGHLEVFYLTELYGSTRWEVWTALQQFGDMDKPSEMRTHAMESARYALPLEEAGQRYLRPGDLPQTPENRLIVVDYVGGDGEKNTYAITDVRDWSAVTILPTPTLAPPCPLPSQNLLQNFHFDGPSLAPWVPSKRQDGGPKTEANLLRSRTPLDVQFDQNPPRGGVRYLSLKSPVGAGGTRGIYQDVPTKKLKDGNYLFAVKLRSENEEGTVRVALQQINAKGEVLATESEGTHPVSATNMDVTYRGPDSTDPKNSVYLASKYVTGRARIAFQRDAVSLRLLIEPKTEGVFNLVDTNLSEENP